MIMMHPFARHSAGCTTYCQRGGRGLSEVGFHHVDHLIGGVRLLRIRFPLRVKHMMPDVAFQELSHQAVDCPSCCADDLQHLRTIASLVENPLQSLKLPSDAFAPQDHLLFVFDCMTHSQTNDIMPTLYTYGGMYSFLCELIAQQGVAYIEYRFSSAEGMSV